MVADREGVDGTAAKTWSLLLLGLGGVGVLEVGDTAGATTTALAFTEATIWPVAVGVAPV